MEHASAKAGVETSDLHVIAPFGVEHDVETHHPSEQMGPCSRCHHQAIDGVRGAVGPHLSHAPACHHDIANFFVEDDPAGALYVVGDRLGEQKRIGDPVGFGKQQCAMDRSESWFELAHLVTFDFLHLDAQIGQELSFSGP